MNSSIIKIRQISITLFLFVIAFADPQTPVAQPLDIPSLHAPAYDRRDFSPYFDAARNRNSSSDWDAFIRQSGIILATQWELAVDAEIAAAMGVPDQSDAFNTPEEYRQYLRRQLDVQKETAYAAWELEALATIAGERDAFLALLAGRMHANTNDVSDAALAVGQGAAIANPAVADAESYDALNKAVIEQEVRWSRQYHDSVDAGLREFAAAIAGVEQDYANFSQSIAERRAEFEQSLAQIAGFEKNVREGIRTQLTSMEGLLGASGIFHAEICDTDNNCAIDPDNLSVSGAQLQALITSMRSGLDNGASLVDLSDQMRSYLETSQIEAEANRILWAGRTTGTESYAAGVGLGPLVLNGGGQVEPSVFAAIPEVLGLENYYRYNDPAAIASLVRQRTGQPAYRTLTIHAADGVAYTPPGSLPLQIPIVSTVSGQGEWYSQAGLSALKYEHTIIVGGLFEHQVIHIPESELQLSVVYTWHDANAAANADRWAGYTADLATMLSRWTDEILPAAQTWQTQRAAYESSFEAWKLDAASKQQAAFEATVNNRNDIVAARNEFIERTDREYAQGQNVWREIKKDVAAAQAASSDLALAKAQVSQAAATIQTAAAGTGLADVQSGLRGLPALTMEFLDRSRQALPELEKLAAFRSGLSQSLAGAQNLTLSESIQTTYERERTKARAVLTEMLRENRLAKSTDADVLVTLLLQRLEPAQVAELGALSYDDLIRRIKSGTGRADSATLTVAAIEDFARLHGVEWEKSTAELIAAERADAEAAVWQVEELEGGRLRAKRSIKDGTANLVGHDGTVLDSYASGSQDQILDIATQAYTQLPTKRGLFEDWDVANVLDEFEDGIQSFYNLTGQQMADIQTAMVAADRYSSHKDQQFAIDRGKKVEQATIIQKAIISAMTGGSFLSGAVGYVQGQILGPIAQDFEKMTGIPAGIWSGLFGGSDLTGSVIGYGLGLLEEAFGVPGLSSYLSQQWGKMEARAARRDAQRIRIEDGPMAMMFNQFAYSSNPTVANFGRGMAGVSSPTYAWRNAEHHTDGAIALQATETVVFTTLNVAGSAIGIGAPLAAGITAGYYATKQAYLGSLHGGSRGALIGFTSGAVNGALSYVTKGVVSTGASYSYADGFNAQVGVNVPFYDNTAHGGLRAGVSLSYNERSGRSAVGSSIGYDFGSGATVGLGVGWDAYGKYQGGALTYGSRFTRPTPADHSGWNVGLNFDRDSFTGVTAGLTNSWQTVDQATGLVGGYNLNTGIGYDWDRDQFTLSTGSYGTFGDTTQHGFNSITSGANSTYTFGQGQAVGVSQSISTNFGVQSRQNAAMNALNQRAYLAALRENSTDPARQAELSEQIAELDEHIDRVTNYERQRIDQIEQLVRDGHLSPGDGQRLIENPELAHSDSRIAEAIEQAGLAAESRGGLSLLTGALTDGFAFLFGGSSDEHGFIDSHGEYVFRTCFTAGTLVRTDSGHKPIEDISAGDLVYSLDEETGRYAYRPVVRLFSKQVDAIHQVTYSDGTIIEATAEHPFFIAGRGWVPAKALRAGQRSVTADGELLIQSVAILRGPVTVYNFEVKDFHTYFVSENDVLVHNECDRYYAAVHEWNKLAEHRIPVAVGKTDDPNSETINKVFKKVGANLFECVENCVHGAERVRAMPDGTVQQELIISSGDRVKAVYRYDENGEMVPVSREIYDPVVRGKTSITYNSSGSVIGRETVYDLGDSDVKNPFGDPDDRTLWSNSPFGERNLAVSPFHRGIDNSRASYMNVPVDGVVVPQSTEGFQVLNPSTGRPVGVYPNGEGLQITGGDHQLSDSGKLPEFVGVPASSSGNSITVMTEQNGQKYYMTFMHMKEPSSYKAGDSLKAGQAVGTVGSTGKSTGNHGHFEVYTHEPPKNIPARYVTSDRLNTIFHIDPAYFLQKIAE